MSFNTEEAVSTPVNPNLLPRAEAQTYCNSVARNKGIRGSYKVFYANTIVESPADLPDMFDKTLIKISATLDQA